MSIKVQTRHEAGTKEFLSRLDSVGGRLMATDVEASVRIRNVCKSRGLAQASGTGRGASWTITEDGKKFLKQAGA